MSRETHEWLSNNTLIGFTEKRGNAWHYREGDSNHYTGAVPVEDVIKRLFSWTPQERPMFMGVQQADTGLWVPGKQIPGRKAITRSDTGDLLGMFGDGYRVHEYPEWLIENVGTLLDTSTGDLGIGSAVLLRKGAVAAVQVEVPETFRSPEGLEFRPFVLASTSLDGSIATSYGRNVTAVVCDNTLDMGLNERGQKIKIRHTRNSLDGKVAMAREALQLIHTTADDFMAEIAKFSSVSVDDKQWEAIVFELTKTEDNASKRSVTMASNKRDALMQLWQNDDRVAPWRGTALGAFQALNTYGTHVQTVKGAERPERNALNVVTGGQAKVDKQARELIMSLAA